VPKILFFMDSRTAGRGATFRLDSGEPCLLSIARPSVRVRKSRHGWFGATLYEEKVVYKSARTSVALAYLYQDYLLPPGFNDPVLRAFANAIMHCGSCSEVSTILNEAATRAEKSAGGSLESLCQADFGSWVTNLDMTSSQK
jgi:hypothetical protein